MAAFQTLQELVVKGQAVSGPLPEAWGSPYSFPQLRNLTVLSSPSLEGPLPVSWGGNGSFPMLRRLIMQKDILGEIHCLLFSDASCQ